MQETFEEMRLALRAKIPHGKRANEVGEVRQNKIPMQGCQEMLNGFRNKDEPICNFSSLYYCFAYLQLG